MSLVFNEEQKLLKTSAADFARKESPVSRIRAFRDSDDKLGFSRELWASMAALGWPAILVPEQYGGLGLGLTEICCVIEELGRNLVPEPLLSNALLGSAAIIEAGSEEQKSRLLPAVVDGSGLVALAWQERKTRYDPAVIEASASSSGGGWTLEGEKVLVWDGHVADVLVVSARTSGAPGDHEGVSLFLVDKGAAGLKITRQQTMDLRNAAVLRFDSVELDSDSLLGKEGEGLAPLQVVIDRATVGLCAEMMGSAEAVFAMTLDYLKTREQFGVVIGSFQALKHRAALIFIELELSRSALMGACEAVDSAADNAAEKISTAKARLSDTAVLAAYEGLQMHGGVGMTDEHDIGFYLKRARAAELSFGDAAWHRDRFATLQGF